MIDRPCRLCKFPHPRSGEAWCYLCSAPHSKAQHDAIGVAHAKAIKEAQAKAKAKALAAALEGTP